MDRIIPRRRRGGRPLGAALLGTLALGLALGMPAAARGTGDLGANAEVAERTLRDHPLRTLDGRAFTLGALRGQVVVVNFWASWCPPCRRELPGLDALNTELAGHGVRVVAVSIDLEAETARRFARAQGLKLPVAHDGPGGLAKSLDLRQVPTTVVLGRDGAVAFTTSASDARAVAAVGAAARRLAAAPTPETAPTAGGTTP